MSAQFTHQVTPHMLGMADSGEQVRFINCGGYPCDLRHAQEHFREGDVLKVENTKIGDWSSTYKFEGHEGTFNTVMFEQVQP